MVCDNQRKKTKIDVKGKNIYIKILINFFIKV